MNFEVLTWYSEQHQCDSWRDDWSNPLCLCGCESIEMWMFRSGK